MANIKGKVFEILPEKSGTKGNKEWIKCGFVIEAQQGTSTKQICFSGWTEMADTVRSLRVGDEVNVSYEPSSRCYNGFWNTDLMILLVDVESKSTEPDLEEDEVSDEGYDVDMPF